METLFIQNLESWKAIIYVILFFSMFIEGDIFLFSVFYLTNQGKLQLWSALAVVFLGVVVGDVVWYFFGNKIAHHLPYLERKVAKFSPFLDRQLHNNFSWSIVISKFTYGIHHMILMRAGSLGISLKKFIKTDVIASMIWIFVIGCIGYTASSVFVAFFGKYVRFTEIGLFVVICAWFIFVTFFSHFIKQDDIQDK